MTNRRKFFTACSALLPISLFGCKVSAKRKNEIKVGDKVRTKDGTTGTLEIIIHHLHKNKTISQYHIRSDSIENSYLTENDIQNLELIS